MKNSSSDAFRLLRTKLTLRAAGLLAAALLAVYALYTFVLRGRFANAAVAFFQAVLRMDSDTALQFYQQVVRRHIDLLIPLSLALLLLVLFHIGLRCFTGYFVRISAGLDALTQEETGPVSLPPELLCIERKMNEAWRAFAQQKNDMRLAEQRKNDLVMYLAHDLKTPLATVIGYLTLLHDEGEIPPALREKYVSISLEKAERLEALINEFLEIAKFNLSSVTLQYTTINLTRLFEQLTYEFEPILRKRGLTCTLDMAGDIPLRCDADKMQRVFDNLLRNAAAYSTDGAPIVIAVRPEPEQLTIRFVNRGPTIPPEKLERIFEQFYRLDSGRGGEGAGLGLAIARQIVTLHRGTISAQSEDGLTTFTVVLPVS